VAFLPAASLWFSGAEKEALLESLVAGLVYGTVIGTAALAVNAVFYAIVVALRIRKKVLLRVPIPIRLLIVFAGLALGFMASTSLIARLLGGPRSGASIIPLAFFTLSVTAGFSLYILYRRAVEEALDMKRAVAEARCRALESGMQPHFLFNSLNCLAELIDEGEMRQASEMTMRLSELYRALLSASQDRTVPLSNETALTRAYLDVEKIRLGPRLSYKIVSTVKGDPRVPSLALQTLTENAVKHGVRPSVTGGEITLKFETAPDGSLTISVTNTGEPWPASATEGFGLSNTRERLSLLYGTRHCFSAGKREPDGATVVSFRIPPELPG
jgi:two-component system sensor histidine kinase AlgZ